MMCSKALNSREKPAVSPISGAPTFDIEKKNRNGANLKLRSNNLSPGFFVTMFQGRFDTIICVYFCPVSNTLYLSS